MNNIWGQRVAAAYYVTSEPSWAAGRGRVSRDNRSCDKWQQRRIIDTMQQQQQQTAIIGHAINSLSCCIHVAPSRCMSTPIPCNTTNKTIPMSTWQNWLCRSFRVEHWSTSLRCLCLCHLPYVFSMWGWSVRTRRKKCRTLYAGQPNVNYLLFCSSKLWHSTKTTSR